MTDLIKVYLKFLCVVLLWGFGLSVKSFNAEAVLNVFAEKYHSLPVAHLDICSRIALVQITLLLIQSW